MMYLRAPLFGGLRLFLNEEPDPCGDGNPAMCEFLWNWLLLHHGLRIVPGLS